MKVGSAFSGIEGFTLGLERTGFYETVWQIENDRFCIRVNEKNYPNVRRYGDITAVDPRELEPVDILVGGFPCQDLSVAGQRAGLAGARSGLFYEFLRIADHLAPRWLLVENVAGLLSSVSPVSASGDPRPGIALGDDDLRPGGIDAIAAALSDAHDFHNGEDFAVLLEGLTGFRPAVPKTGWRSSGVCRGPKRTAAWRVFDSRYFGVAQRRRRVFIVCGPGDAGAVALLSDAEGGRGDIAASRAERAEVAGTIGGGAPDARGRRDDLDTSGAFVTGHALRARPNNSFREDAETFVTGPISGGDYGAGRDGSNDFPNIAGPHVARPLTSSMSKHHDEDTDTIVGTLPAGVRQQPGSTADGAAAGHIVTPLQDVGGTRKKRQNGMGIGEPGDQMYTLTEQDRHGVVDVAHTLTRDGADASEDGTGRGTPIVASTLTKGSHNDRPGGRHKEDDANIAVFRKAKRASSDEDDETWVDGDVANTLNQFDGGDVRATELAIDEMYSGARRLTPTECEILQGFPPGWTCLCGVVPYSTMTCKCPDGPRYAANGNAVTVPVISSIGRRIAAADPS